LLVPKVGCEAAYFNSRDQKVSHIEATSDGVLCTYESLRREGSGEHDPETIPIRVRYRIRVVDRQVLFSIEVNEAQFEDRGGPAWACLAMKKALSKRSNIS
jgi:hypothetical protein